MKAITALAFCLSLFSSLASAAGSASDKTLDLSGFEGTWIGRSADGRFEETTTYTWNADRTYLNIKMVFRTDGEKTGTGEGYMLIEDTTGTLRFSMISSQGAVIDQQQISGDSSSVEMEATAVNAQRVGMPPTFRTRIHIYDQDHYWTELLVHADGKWTTAMQNEFEREK